MHRRLAPRPARRPGQQNFRINAQSDKAIGGQRPSAKTNIFRSLWILSPHVLEPESVYQKEVKFRGFPHSSHKDIFAL